MTSCRFPGPGRVWQEPDDYELLNIAGQALPLV